MISISIFLIRFDTASSEHCELSYGDVRTPEIGEMLPVSRLAGTTTRLIGVKFS